MSLTGWPVQAELPNTRAFAAASENFSPEDVGEAISCGPSVERHVAAVTRYFDAGFDHIILVQIGPDQKRFVEFFEKELGPALRAAA